MNSILLLQCDPEMREKKILNETSERSFCYRFVFVPYSGRFIVEHWEMTETKNSSVVCSSTNMRNKKWATSFVKRNDQFFSSIHALPFPLCNDFHDWSGEQQEEKQQFLLCLFESFRLLTREQCCRCTSLKIPSTVNALSKDAVSSYWRVLLFMLDDFFLRANRLSSRLHWLKYLCKTFSIRCRNKRKIDRLPFTSCLFFSDSSTSISFLLSFFVSARAKNQDWDVKIDRNSFTNRHFHCVDSRLILEIVSHHFMCCTSFSHILLCFIVDVQLEVENSSSDCVRASNIHQKTKTSQRK